MKHSLFLPKLKANILGILFFLALLAMAGPSRAGNPIELVKHGKSRYSIVISAGNRPAEVRAASLLQKYVLQISGFKLPVNTVAGNRRRIIQIKEDRQIAVPDGYSIESSGRNIYIYGGTGKGCVYGVISLLERYLGCRYYSPSFKLVPQSENIILPPIHIRDAPANSIRIVNISEETNQDFQDWTRLSTIDDFFARGYYVHTMNRLVPWQEYFKSHPEYYAEVNGKRVIDQLCWSEPEVLKLVISKLEKEMAVQPDKLYWSVSQNDNPTYCHCARCQKIIDEEKSPAGPIIRFVNEVARHFPDKIISTLAYQYSRPAPVITRPAKNVQVMLCTIELNRSEPIAVDKTSESFRKDIVDWGKICHRIYLWDYTIDFAHSVSPFPNLHVLQPNIQFFMKNNVRAHFQQSNSMRGQEFAELKLYLISRLLWNPAVNTDSVINDFLNGYYGPAGPSIRKYIDQMQSELLKSGERLDIYGPPADHENGYLSASNIDDYNGYFKAAEEAVAGDSARLMHVRIARLSLQYAIMEIGKNNMFGPRGWYQERNGEFIPIGKMRKTLENFYKICQSADIPRLNESGLTPKAYYESTRRFINIVIKGNLAFGKKVTADTPPSPKYSHGDLSYLTNGVRGSSDFRMHWLGWEGRNFSLTLDLGNPVTASSLEISSLWNPQSWILHPREVTCLVSDNGQEFEKLGSIEVAGDQKKEEITRLFAFKAPAHPVRFVKFQVNGTLHLFSWHPAAGSDSWVFIDEIVVH